MRCGDGSIDIAAFNAIYHVTLDNNDRPVRYEIQPFTDGQKVPQEFTGAGYQNLGLFGRAYPTPVRVLLAAKERGETDRNAQEIRARVLFQGRGHRECGE